MKKLLLMTFAVSLMYSAAAQSNNTSDYPKGSRVLVAYFSASGVTEAAAQQLAKVVNGDLYAITPATAYSEADLNWRNPQSRSSVEMHNDAARPEMADKNAHIENYDVIYLGYPIWWDLAPRIINTFIESYNFSGKLIVPFATSGSSNITNSKKNLSATYLNIKWGEGMLLNGATEESIRQQLDRRVW